MPKYKICVTKVVHFHDHLEIEASNDLEARNFATKFARQTDLKQAVDSDYMPSMDWVEDKKPVYKAEVVNG